MTSLQLILQRCAAMHLKRRIERRFDRCCHGGTVSYRLPLGVRLHAANRFPEPVILSTLAEAQP